MPLFPTGKLPHTLLQTLIERYGTDDPSVVVRPGIGFDAAAIDLGDVLLVAKTDPITFATDEIGWYAVHVNANDVACLGATPRWFLATILLPEKKTDETLVESIFEQIYHACAPLSVSLVGGHTEVTHGINRPIVSGQMLGTVSPERLVTPRDARAGDQLLIAKGFPIEGTAIIAGERADVLRERGYDEDTIEAARRFLHDPGLSVVDAARIALEAGPVHAMHDPTEGGVATGLIELAEAADLGLIVDADALPLLDLGAQLCAEFGLDPLGTIASGALLLAVPTGHVDEHLTAYERAGVPAAVVGELVPLDDGRWLIRDGTREPMPRFDTDEITKLF